MKIVIIGGVAAGTKAAAKLKREERGAQVKILTKSNDISYAGCGLPYYIGGVIQDKEELTLQTPENFRERFRIDVRVRHEVTAIHPDKKTVSVKNLKTGEEFEENYDKLLLSPGARPVQPNLPGVGIDNLFTLRTVEDTLRIREFVLKEKPKSAVLAGGGYIGLEVAENLRELGMDVTIVQRPNQVLNPLDYEMATFVHAKMREKGIHLMLGHSVEGFEQKDGKTMVILKDGEPLKTDMVILAIGVAPDTHLAKNQR